MKLPILWAFRAIPTKKMHFCVKNLCKPKIKKYICLENNHKIRCFKQ